MILREILFRAKRIDNGEWVEGNVIHSYDADKEYKTIIIPVKCSDMYTDTDDKDIGFETWYKVNPETLCQYTGLNDKNGKRIWENDIVKHEVSDTIGTIKWYQEDYVGWCVDDIVIDEQQFTDEMWCECEVIGNIFDNPELLKGE